ncbi:MAG: ABC transporter permease [Candidatus Bathyarchaeota archaeon]|nr:ABC transporter permease [Candidatus Bathyarchaeota archaeon]
MGIVSRAIRNISRRKIRALLVIIALGFSMAIMISIPAGVIANQQAATTLATNLGNTITETGQTINQTLLQIDCSLSSDFAGFGFGPQNFTFVPGQGDRNGFSSGGSSGGSWIAGLDPSQFGGGTVSGRFGGGAFGGGQANPMNESLYTDISQIAGVAAVEPVLQASEGSNVTTSFMGRTFTRMVPDYTIEGIPLISGLIDNYPIVPTNITSGRTLQAGDSGVVVLSENNSAYFNAGVGDTISILDNTFKVVGIHGSSGVSDTIVLYMNLSDAQRITNNEGYITSLRVFATSSDVVSQVATDIQSLHPELTVTTGQERLNQLQSLQSAYDTALANAQASIAQTEVTAFEEIIVVITATSLIVLFVMLYTVRERTKEIGTLKAIGFSNATVMGQFILEGILLSLIAGVVGIAIGVVAAPTISGLILPSVNLFSSSSTPFARALNMPTVAASVNLELIALAFGAALLLGALGSLYPAWRAAKIRPAEAMKYE